jgi:hypothetical protein
VEKIVICQDTDDFVKVLATNSADTSFTAPVATTTKPTAGVVNLARQSAVPQWLAVVPYGTGGDDSVFEMWITGWRKVATLWVPQRLVKLTCTLSTSVGVAGAALVATERLCDTITATGGISNVSYQLFSTTDNTPAHALVSPNGCSLIQFTFDLTTGTPTGANALYSRV